MDFSSLSIERKLIIVDNLIEQTLLDIYRVALGLNLTPEALDVDWTPEEGHDYQENALNQLLDSLARLKAMQIRRAGLEG